MSEEKDEEKQGEEAKEAASSQETPVETPASEEDTVVSAGSATLEKAGESEPSMASTPEAAADPEREAKLKAAAEARAARAAAKEAANAGGAPAGEAAEPPPPPPPPSPKQPQLDAAARLIRSLVHEEALEDAYINEMNGHMPTFIVKNEHWLATAVQLKQHEELHFSYLRNVSGVDYETHLEVVYHLVDLESRRELAVKIKADRSTPVVASATPVWATANWNEREIYDLLGVTFPGHPDLRRIMMSDDWVGHPLRKDYEPLDSEV